MTTDEFKYQGKMRRRKRKSDGQAFNDGLGDQLDALQPLKDSGLFCKNCSKWWKWKDYDISWDFGKTTIRSWVCKKCGQVVKEEVV